MPLICRVLRINFKFVLAGRDAASAKGVCDQVECSKFKYRGNENKLAI